MSITLCHKARRHDDLYQVLTWTLISPSHQSLRGLRVKEIQYHRIWLNDNGSSSYIIYIILFSVVPTARRVGVCTFFLISSFIIIQTRNKNKKLPLAMRVFMANAFNVAAHMRWFWVLGSRVFGASCLFYIESKREREGEGKVNVLTPRSERKCNANNNHTRLRSK